MRPNRAAAAATVDRAESPRRRRVRRRRTEPPTGPAPLAAVIACAARTLTAPSARIQIRTDADLGRRPASASPRRRPGLAGQARGPRRPRRSWERVAPEIGAAEMPRSARHSCTSSARASSSPPPAATSIDFGGWAQVLVDGRRFSGLSGEPLGPRYENRPERFRRDDPLDALRQTASRDGRPLGRRRDRCAGPPAAWPSPRRARTSSRSGSMTSAIRRFQTVERGSGRSVLGDQDRDGRALGLRRPGRLTRLVPPPQPSAPPAPAQTRRRPQPALAGQAAGPRAALSPPSSSRTRGTTSVP